MSERILGLSAAETMFESMGDEAREAMGEMLAEIAIEALAIQQSRAPIDKGNLALGLGAQVQIEALRAKMGLIDTKAGRSRLFYGRPVDHGVAAQTVLVQRRRRVGGRLRTSRRRKIASDIVSTYSLHVKARPGAYFIEAPDLGELADSKLAEFWTRAAPEASA